MAKAQKVTVKYPLIKRVTPTLRTKSPFEMLSAMSLKNSLPRARHAKDQNPITLPKIKRSDEREFYRHVKGKKYNQKGVLRYNGVGDNDELVLFENSDCENVMGTPSSASVKRDLLEVMDESLLQYYTSQLSQAKVANLKRKRWVFDKNRKYFITAKLNKTIKLSKINGK